MPYAGRLPALARGQACLIVGFDATHALVINHEGKLEYIDHRDIEVTLHSDPEAVLWMDYGSASWGASVPDASDGDAAGDDASADDTDGDVT